MTGAAEAGRRQDTGSRWTGRPGLWACRTVVGQADPAGCLDDAERIELARIADEQRRRHGRVIPRTRQLARPWRGDRGAGAAELVIAVPLLMLLILLIVQFAIWAHASSVAQATAEEALADARVQGGSAAAGQQRAAQVSGRLL